MNSEKALYEYPYSKKWVFFSCVLTVLSITFTLLALSDPISILLFFAFTFILAGIFFLLKLRLYSMKTEHELGSHFALEEKVPRRFFVILLLVLFVALFLPFLLLLILEPLSWFISITGFIAGVNIPEVFLYLYFRRGEKRILSLKTSC